MKTWLVELIVHLLGDLVVVGSNLAKKEFNFLFAKVHFGMGMRRVRKP